MIVACCKCKTTKEVKPTSKGNPRPPKTWKLNAGLLYCRACYAESFVDRAIMIPIRAAIGHETLYPIWEAIDPLWKASIRTANWCIVECAKIDPLYGHDPNIKPWPQMPAWPKGLYGHANANCPFRPILTGATLREIVGQVERDYRSDRGKVCVGHSRSLRTYRSMPYYFDLLESGLAIIDGDLHIEVPLAAGRGQRATLRLARDKGHRRSRDTLKRCLDPASGCSIVAAAMLKKKARESDHRNTGSNGESKGDRWEIWAKIVIRMPITSRNGSKSLAVHTDPDALLVALDAEGERIWTYHRDDAVQLVTRHNKHLQTLDRLSDDRKLEKRKPRRDGKKYLAMLDQRSKRDAIRTRGLCHEISRAVVNYAARRRFSEIRYDDSYRGFCGSFPWAMLRSMIEQKAHAEGIQVSIGPVAEKAPDSLEEGEVQ